MSLIAAVRYCIYNDDKSQMLKESPEGGAEFVVKEGVALPALPIALKTMKKGEKASLILRPGCEFTVSMPLCFVSCYLISSSQPTAYLGQHLSG